MKQMRRFLSVLVILVLCLGFTGSAYASSTKYNQTVNQQGNTTAAYSSTQSFLDAMDAEEILYIYHGLDIDQDDWVEVIYTGDYCDTIDIDIYFSSDNDRASFRFWNVIDFNSSDYREILGVVNQLNADYKWVKFVVDTQDYSVTAELDVLFPIGDAGEICLVSLDQIVNISDFGYHALEPYIKK